MAIESGSALHREELHRAIVRESPTAIFLIESTSRRILEANAAALELVGYENEEFCSLLLDDVDVTPGRDLPRMLRRVVKTHNDLLGERTLRRRNGTLVPVEASANLIISGGLEVVCYFSRDITERRTAERESERLHRALALSQKHEAVGRLAAGIAHDFNNQLMVMTLCAELVGDSLGSDDPSQQEIEDLLTAGKSAAGLIKQLLAFSGQQILRPTLMSPDVAIEEQSRLLSRTLGEHIRIATLLSDDPKTVLFDRTQFEQVIVNLAVNARDAMPRGGTFTIETSVVEVGKDFTQDFATLRDGRHILIKVSDTGSGMDEETLARLFEPFFTTKGAGGTGLGLATVYGIIKQSGGSIWASSTPDVGTSFRIFLPVAEGEADAEVRDEHVVAVATPLANERILVVDDDEMVRVLVSRILRDLGYIVYEATGRDEAMNVCAEIESRGEAPVELILSDVVMPDESGPSMVREVVGRFGASKVLFMSGYATDRLKEEDLSASDFVLLSKPLGRSVLADAVRSALNLHEAPGESTNAHNGRRRTDGHG